MLPLFSLSLCIAGSVPAHVATFLAASSPHVDTPAQAQFPNGGYAKAASCSSPVPALKELLPYSREAGVKNPVTAICRHAGATPGQHCPVGTIDHVATVAAVCSRTTAFVWAETSILHHKLGMCFYILPGNFNPSQVGVGDKSSGVPPQHDEGGLPLRWRWMENLRLCVSQPSRS